MNKIILNQEQLQKPDVEYPDLNFSDNVKVYLDGYLVKSVYEIQKDPKSQLKVLKFGEKTQLNEIVVMVRIEVNGMRKVIEVTGLMSNILIQAWEKIEGGG